MASRLLVMDIPAETLVAQLDCRIRGYSTPAAVRAATPADVRAAFVAQCQADGSADRVRATVKAEGQPYASMGTFAESVLGALDLEALLEAPETETGGER